MLSFKKGLLVALALSSSASLAMTPLLEEQKDDSDRAMLTTAHSYTIVYPEPDYVPAPLAEDLLPHLVAAGEIVKALEPEPEPEPEPYSVPEPWFSLAVCESGMNGVPRWSYNGSSGFDGGLQFHPGTWVAFGGEKYASHAYAATPRQQIEIAEKVLSAQGWGAWPSCSSKLGLR